MDVNVRLPNDECILVNAIMVFICIYILPPVALTITLSMIRF